MLVATRTDEEFARLMGAIYMKNEPDIDFNGFLDHYMHGWWIFQEHTVVDTVFESVFNIKFTTAQAVDNAARKSSDPTGYVVYSVDEAIARISPKPSAFVESVAERLESGQSQTLYGVNAGRMLDIVHAFGKLVSWDPDSKVLVTG